MPLCFNLFAPLRQRPDEAADLLRRALGLDIAELVRLRDIEGIECEWAPDKALTLGDRTAFDAAVAYRDSAGARCLLGIETKYTETFSRKQYGDPGDPEELAHRASYQKWSSVGWFHVGAADRLWRSDTNQLWRNVMLGVACEALDEFDRVDVAVIALHRDPHAQAALRGVRAVMTDPGRLRDVSLERLMRLGRGGEVDEWSRAMSERYLNLSLVADDDTKSRDRLQRRLDQLFPSGCEIAYDNGGEEPYVVHCPHPVVRLVDRHLEILLWREDHWSGQYKVHKWAVVDEPDGTQAVDLAAGRFVVRDVRDPAIRRAMAGMRFDAARLAAAQAG
jgi:hypothetical protein